MLDVVFAKPALPKTGGLLLLVAEDEPQAGLWAEADAATGGAIARAVAVAGFKGGKGQTLSLIAPGAGLSHLALVGLGKRAEITPLGAAEAGGRGLALLTQAETLALAAPGLAPDLLAEAAHGAVLRGYRFDRYRTREKPEDKPKLARLSVLAEGPEKVKTAYAPLEALAEGVFFTRDLVSEPANILTPAEFADRVEKLGELGLKIEVFEPKALAKLGFGALLGVAQGSANEPRVVAISWHGSGARKKDQKPLAFIGKGVTFDTGGISIKPAAGMEDMKWDMAGAGTVAGLMATLARRKAKVDAIGLIGLVENMPSGTAQRPGDVVTSHSGQTIEVINTDAEGRLVLADLMSWCQEEFSPRLMIDLATLTGAIIVGLGHEHAGLFANDDELANRLLEAGRMSGDKLWRMPLAEAYDRLIKSHIADMKNVGGRPAGAITAAQFLQRFVRNGTPWAHLDIAGMAWSEKDSPLAAKGASGFGVRLLDRLVARFYEG